VARARGLSIAPPSAGAGAASGLAAITAGTVAAVSAASAGDSKKDRKSTGSRFTIYKVNKASKKKREKSSAKKERKATKTLAIVLGEFTTALTLLLDVSSKKYEESLVTFSVEQQIKNMMLFLIPYEKYCALFLMQNISVF
jgi:hypothetical protein